MRPPVALLSAVVASMEVTVPRFSINASFMLTEHDFLDRFQAAADLGFRAVDVQFPYDVPAEDIGRRVRAAGVEVVLINLPPGNRAAGEAGLASLPDRVEEFRAGVALARRYCDAMMATRVNILSGRPPAGADRDACRAALLRNLGFAATEFVKDGVQAMIEFINTRDVPGFFLPTAEAARAAIEEVGHDNLWLQFDLYHRQAMSGELILGVERHLDRIAHIQFADNPGRHEPGTGEINFPSVFAALDRLGYDGWVGAEYLPTTSTAESLTWYRPYRN